MLQASGFPLLAKNDSEGFRQMITNTQLSTQEHRSYHTHPLMQQFAPHLNSLDYN